LKQSGRGNPNNLNFKMSIIIFFIVLLFSVILHEIAHGAVAEHFGDDTARVMGRITLNPISHIDPYFTILVPLLLYFSGAPIIGGAKPVPVNYFKLNNFRWGVFWVSIAGVLTNLFLALVFSLPLRFMLVSQPVHDLFIQIISLNVFLAIFNTIPIPPLDGSKVFAALLGEWAIKKVMSLEMRGLLGVLPFFIVIYVLFSTSVFQTVMLPIANFFFRIFGVA
jgi:Zn-dependent protease